MARKARIDTIAGAAGVLARARFAIEPPETVPLTAEERVHFDAVVREFATSEVSDHIAEVAALLARQMRDLERQSAALRLEEDAVPIPAPVNPRRKAVLDLTRSVMALRRSLQIHGRALNGEAGEVATRRARAREIEEAAGIGHDAPDDGLLARRQ